MHLIKSERYIAALKKINCEGLSGKTVMITGATGMIGSCLVDALAVWNQKQKTPCRIVALSRRESTAKERFSYCWDAPYFQFIEQDICKEPQNWPEKIDYIVHAASNADPKNFAKAPVDTLVANVMGTNFLLRYGLRHGMNRFLYVSSGEMYGQPDAQQHDFTEVYCGPIDYSVSRACYPAGKRAAEVLCQSYISQYGIDAVIVRPCHVFGPTMTRSDSRAVSEFLRNAVLGEKIAMKSAGLVERSHCYVVDAADAIFTVLLHGESGNAYNIADPACQMTIRDFAKLSAEAGNCQIVFENPSDLEIKGYSKVSRSVLDSAKLQKLGWKGQSDAKIAVAETVQILHEMNEVDI